MQAPDFTTSAFKPSMLQRRLSVGDGSDDVIVLHSSAAEQLSAAAFVAFTTTQQRLIVTAAHTLLPSAKFWT